jgi:hypothetical protein
VAISNRVELLPQSSAATVSVTHVNHEQLGHIQLVRDEFTDGIVTTNEVVRQVRVQTLHADPRATNAAGRLDAVVVDRRRESSLGVAIVGTLQLGGVDERLESVNSAIALETTHGVVQFAVDQPVQRGHGRAVTKVRLIFNDDRAAVETSYDNRAPPRQRPPHEVFEDRHVVG